MARSTPMELRLANIHAHMHINRPPEAYRLSESEARCEILRVARCEKTRGWRSLAACSPGCKRLHAPRRRTPHDRGTPRPTPREAFSSCSTRTLEWHPPSARCLEAQSPVPSNMDSGCGERGARSTVPRLFEVARRHRRFSCAQARSATPERGSTALYGHRCHEGAATLLRRGSP